MRSELVGILRRPRRHAEHMKPVQGLTAELTEQLHEVSAHLEAFAAKFGDMADRLRAAEDGARRVGQADERDA